VLENSKLGLPPETKILVLFVLILRLESLLKESRILWHFINEVGLGLIKRLVSSAKFVIGSGLSESGGVLKGSSGGKEMSASITILSARGLAPNLNKPGEGMCHLEEHLF